MTAMAEARRAATLELAEASVRPLPASVQKELADRLAAGPQQKQGKDDQAKKQGQKKKKSGKSSGDSSTYVGTKK